MSNPSGSSAKSRKRSDVVTTIGLVGVLLFFVFTGFVSYWNVRTLEEDSQQVVQTHQVITALDDLLSIMKDAETGQRGYIITHDEAYLAPYNDALVHVDERIHELERLTGGNLAQKQRIPDMKVHIHAKLTELAETIELRRTQSFEAAMKVIVNDRGKNEMDALRNEIGLTMKEEQIQRDASLAEMAGSYRVAIFSGILTGLLGVLLSAVVSFQVRSASANRERQEWIQTGQVGLASAMFGEQRGAQLADNILTFVAEYCDASVGAFYALEGDIFVRLATYGLPEDAATPGRFIVGDGLLGQAVQDKRAFYLNDVPPGYLAIGTSLVKGNPRYLIVSPCVADGLVNSVFELGFIQAATESATQLLESLSNPIGLAIRSANDRSSLQNLLEETQAQSEELQAQGEELRVSNEELEEQSRALKESQFRLEQQQAELEQTNTQLEEQTQLLEAQRDDLNRSKEELENQAQDLERTSRYKSDFLANMSHELRTPLNSSLILAKLLADNRDGNLTAEQVKYAQTIQTAGNDLLALISDILDLSKIEAGHMEVHIQRLRVEEVVASLKRTFEPLAGEKRLSYRATILPGTPSLIETDSQRLEQVLKNLISNAIKFTEKGEVTLDVRPGAAGFVDFVVTDTGIGIGPHQVEMVFEAFRQADGTTNRKYGGTGLGLSISRELAHLLGGEIDLVSELGKGSTFTLSIPEVLVATEGESVSPVAPPSPRPNPRRESVSPAQVNVPAGNIPDDRERLAQGTRLILVVEDDVRFAEILFELAHEHGFQCLIASSAEAALALAVQFLPSAVLLDIGLPDHSGLSVLDRLKHDGRTRHIPVHVVSGSDYSRTAMALGAVGYMLKPVKHEELVQAFESLEARLTQRLRRVLVVEDDEVQLDSLRLLLGSRDVETVGVRSAGECLEILRDSTFDCMVLDLSLPDASGFSLLKTLSEEDSYAFPPVIVYTGRDLSSEEEQQLRRYSKSIIIKGAKSPERLLDEVTLFLHQVVADLPADKRMLIEKAKHRDAALEDRLILIVEDDIRNIFALTSVLEPRGAKIEIARNGREALEVLERTSNGGKQSIDLVLMDIMMPEMDGFTAMREIRKKPEWKKLPIIALTAKAMKNDQEQCLDAGANDYIAKPLDVEKLLSLIRVWMPR